MKFVRDLEDLLGALEMRHQMLDVSTVESHARFDEVEIALLECPPFDRLLLPFSISEFGQPRAIFVVDFAMGVPQANFRVLSSSSYKVFEQNYLTCCAIPDSLSDGTQRKWYLYFAIKTSISA
jgi:hypothetical protein